MSERRRARRLALVGLALLWLLLSSASPALAHASLGSTVPAAGQNVAEASLVQLTFREPVSLLPGAVRILAADGSPVIDEGPVDLDGFALTRQFVTPLADGAYLVAWRVVSADGHPIEGAFSFGVGEGASPLATAPGTDTGMRPLSVARGITTATGTLALLVMAGALFSRQFVLRGHSMRDRASMIGRRAGRMALWTAIVAVPLESAILLDVSPFSAVTPSALGALAGTSVGLLLIVRITALGLASATQGRAMHRTTLALASVALASPALAGHTRTIAPTWLLTSSDLVHLAVAAVWLGGLVVLGDALRSRRRPPDAAVVADVVARFSGTAAVSLLAVTVTGLILAGNIVDTAGPIGASAYGSALIAKVAVVAVLVAFGAYNRVALVPAVRRAGRPMIAGGSADALTLPVAVRPHAVLGRHRVALDAATMLRRTVRVELGLFAVVLAVTAGLVDLSPPAPTTRTDVGAYLGLGGGISARFDATVDARGPEAMAVRLIDRVGQPFRSDDVTIVASQASRDIGDTAWPMAEVSPGRWALDAEVLALPGKWDLTIVVRTSRFTEETGGLFLTVLAPA